MNLQNIFDSTDFVHASGTKEELAVAEFLKGQCESLGVSARIEPFRVAMSDIEEAHLFADGKEIPCKAFNCCGSGVVEGELYYMPGTDPVSMAGAKDKVVLFDTQGIGFFAYQDLMKAGAKAILFQYGNAYYPNDDIDQRDLREVVSREKKVLCAMIHSRQAVELVKNKVKTIRLEVSQKEYDGESHNVIAGLPGKREEFIVLTAHYDSTSLSHGAYDNMSGCAGLLGIMEAMKDKELNYGLRFVFCGSEERGLLGSKAYVRDHEKELEKVEIQDEVTDEICDVCGRNMVIKYGPHGRFLACPGFPECRNTKPYYEKIGVACPKCGKDVVLKKTQKGRKYYGCIDNPECDFMSWQKPSAKKCPVCGSYMVEKGNKIVCSETTCGYVEQKSKED